MTTTNKLVSLDDVYAVFNSSKSTVPVTIRTAIYALPTYPEPTKGSNYALLQEYIDSEESVKNGYFADILKEIQSQLTEGVEYEIGKEYMASDNKKDWDTVIFTGYHTAFRSYKYIRPIQTSPELASAISLLEATGEYIITKK